MNTLDFGEIMQRDCWFEDYDLSCPFCEGTGERTVYRRGCVESFEEFEGVAEEEGVSCEECGGQGEFEVLWNTAFEVDCSWCRVSDSETQQFAWEHGFCLVDHGGTPYLLMGMCGLDCTWKIHYVRWKLQGFLSSEDVEGCMGSGGYVFLSRSQRKELCAYLLERMTSPADYAEHYKREQEKLRRIAGSG